MGPDNDGHRLGTDAPHLLVRRLACTDGAVEVERRLRAAPGVRAGRAAAVAVDGGVTARGGAEWLVLTSPDALDAATASHGARRGYAARRRSRCTSRCTARRSSRRRPAIWSQDELAGAGWTNTVGAWQSWSAHAPDLRRARGRTWCTTAAGCCRGCRSSRAARSSRRRRPRCRRASAANATGTTATAWVRDASFTMEALWVAACPDEAERFLRVHGDGCRLGHRTGPRSADHVRRRRRARPDRAGAAASRRLAGQPSGPGRQRRVEPAADRRLRRAARAPRTASPTSWPMSTRTRSASWSPAPTPRRAAGGRRTRASGRSAASPSTSCTPR